MPKPYKIKKVMHEWKEGELRSGSKKGPKVKSRAQAVAIALSEAGMSKKRMKKHNPAAPYGENECYKAMNKIGIH